jgi:outer membrane biosynthesis protein TonB
MIRRHYHGGHGTEGRAQPFTWFPRPPSVSVYSVVVLLALVSTGCARAHAKTVPDLPDAPLVVPAPPPHEVEAVDVETPQPPAPSPAPEPSRAQPPRPRPAAPREQPRPEAPKPPEPPPPPEPPKPAEEPPRGTNTLQTTPPTAEGELERTVRATLTRASNELGRIDYRVLSPDAREQYDTAKRFIRQANDAVSAKNLVFAKSLADKAATIAAQLGGR